MIEVIQVSEHRQTAQLFEEGKPISKEAKWPYSFDGPRKMKKSEFHKAVEQAFGVTLKKPLRKSQAEREAKKEFYRLRREEAYNRERAFERSQNFGKFRRERA